MSKLSRRQFIQNTALAAGAVSLPHFAIGKPGASANSKINCAVVGIAGQGGYATRRAADLENLVALCDVDKARGGRYFNKHSSVPAFTDYRKMFDKMHKDIDAVLISTPDHTHFPIAMAAMEHGKHVFVQKPLAHNVWQVRTMKAAAKKYNVITQMGNQGHVMEGMRLMKAWTDAGVIGDVTEVITWTNRPIGPWFIEPKVFPLPKQPVPDTLDWDLWQGPVAERNYSNEYVPVKWRGWWDYGCGSLGDIGCHTFDGPFWILDLGMPTKVEVERIEPRYRGFITMSSVVTYHFPARGNKPPVVMKWYEKGHDVPKPKRWSADKPLAKEGGMYVEGTKETLYHPGMRPNSPRLTPDDRFKDAKPSLAKIDRLPGVGKGPIEEMFHAIKGEGKAPGSNFEYAAPLTEVVLLGALAQRTGISFEWDAKNMKVKGHPELDSLIKEPVRKGWEIGEGLI
jgi:predicted dehydrogenase